MEDDMDMSWLSGLKGIIHFSTSNELRVQASGLLSLSKRHRGKANILASCATVVLAAAIEQGIMDVLYNAAANYALMNDTSLDNTPYNKLFDVSLRKRMSELPEVLTDYKYELDKQNQNTNELNNLIAQRNRLMHKIEHPEFFTLNSENVELIGMKLHIRKKLPKSLWLTITIEEAQRYDEAVRIYFEEVLFPVSGEIQAGIIVIPKK